MKNSVVSQTQRKENEADKLLKKVGNIRKRCQHDFRLLKKVPLRESLVEGVFILYSVDRSGGAGEVFLKCTGCSKEVDLDPLKTCPRCLGKLKKGKVEHAGSREKYWGESHHYYAAQRYTCKACGLIGVADEWDQ